MRKRCELPVNFCSHAKVYLFPSQPMSFMRLAFILVKIC
jgi:hypothetical protein